MTDQAGPILPEGFQEGKTFPENHLLDPMVRIISFLLLTIIFSVGLFPVMLEGQTLQPVYHILSKDQGLKSSTVYCVFEDSRGYLWIGTDTGPVRYDGVSFEELPADRPAIHRSSVFHIQEDSTGKVWMMTFTGNLYFTRNDSLIYSELSAIVKSYKKNRWIQDFYISPDQSLFFPVDFTGIVRITQEGQDSLYEAKVQELLLQDFPDKCLITFSQSYNQVALSESDFLIRPFTLRFISNKQESNQFKFKPRYQQDEMGRIKAVRISASQILILYHRGIYLVQDGRLVRTTVLPSGACAFSRSPDGQILIGYLDQQGLEIYDSVDDLFDGHPTRHFNGSSIGFLSWDHKGGCWLATLEHGVIYIPDWQKQVLTLEGTPGNNHIRSLLSGEDSLLLVGTHNGLIYQGNPFSADMKSINRKPLPTYPTSFAWIRRNERFLVTIATGTLLGFGDCKKNTLSIHPDSEWRGFMNVGAQRIRHASGKPWVMLSGTYGWMRYDPNEHCAIWSSRVLDDHRANDAVEIPDGRIWVGKLDGLYAWDQNKLTPVPFGHPSVKSSIRSLLWSEEKQALIYGTMDGELGWIRGDSLTVLSPGDGLLHSPIWEIIEDDTGNLWTATDEGVNIVRIPSDGEPRIRTLRKAEGLPSLEVTSLAETSSHVVIGTAAGILLYPKNSPAHPCPVPIIRDVTVNQRPRSLKSIRQLSNTENSLAFRYVSVEPSRLGSLTYRYRLDPSQAWVMTTETEVLFLQLRPADYTFEVQAKGSDTEWSPSLLVPFSIPPPFWQTWWFIGLAVISVAGASGWGVRWRNQIARKEEELYKEIDQLERSALKAQMNPHFIFNCLNSIQNLIARDDKSGAMTYLVHFATLIRKILHFSDSRYISLDDEIRMLESYLALEQLRFRNTLNYRIDVHHELDPEQIFIPPMMVQPFVENAIKHGIANLQGGGVVMVRFSPGSPGHVHVDIEDNGTGIQAQQKPREQRNTPSVGIAKTRRRLDLLTDNKQQIEIRPVKDEQEQTKGTLVSLDLPVRTWQDFNLLSHKIISPGED